jgi:hypothetical protein
MELLNLFGKMPKKEVELIDASTTMEGQRNNSEKERLSGVKNDDDDTHTNRQITITWGTGMPIDIIFNFIHKNFEEDGFQDALVNSDITYRDTKEKIIRNDLEMLFRRIILRYKNDIREIGVNIDNAQKAYALTACGKLQARRETYEEHLAEIYEMQRLLQADDPKMTTMIESYRRGFLKGIASKAISFINND